MLALLSYIELQLPGNVRSETRRFVYELNSGGEVSSHQGKLKDALAGDDL